MMIRMLEKYWELPREECEKDPVLMRLLWMGLYNWTNKDAGLPWVGLSLPGSFVHQDNKVPLVCTVHVVYHCDCFTPLSKIDGA